MDELTEYLTNNAEDGFWDQIQSEARHQADCEPMLGSFLFASVLGHKTLEEGLSAILANKLHTPELPAIVLKDLIAGALADDVSIRASIRADLLAARTRDPAARAYSQPFLYYKGFHALQAYRVAHWLWARERHALAAHLQNRVSEAFAVDIHPAARIGSGILIDHATGVVIGETAVVEDNVSMLHEVTLGGTGKESGDRHPKVRRGVLIGAAPRSWAISKSASAQSRRLQRCLARRATSHNRGRNTGPGRGPVHRCRTGTRNGLDLPVRLGRRRRNLIGLPPGAPRAIRA